MSKLLHSKIVGKGEPLLILHGLLGMGDNWMSLARRYAGEGYEVHLIDQRNHGKSFHSEEMNYEVMIDDIKTYITHYQLTKLNLIGHSMGGKTAMFFSLAFPEFLKKLIIVDISPKYYPPHHQFIFDALKKINLKEYKSRKEVDLLLEKDISSPAIRQFLLKNLGRHKDGSFYWKAHLPVLEESLDELGRALPPHSTIHTNTLFIKGEQSKYITDKDLVLIKAHFPHSQVVSIARAGHWVHAEQATLFYTETTRFLNQ